MRKLKILNVVGARPNFVKICPLIKAMKCHHEIDPILVHTGQHYDVKMSENFFTELEIPPPNYNLGVKADSHAQQTALIIMKFEEIVLKEKPDLILVVGDVNSTLASALTACKLGIPVAHVEAGLRSFDRGMPEEINRILTDHISEYLFTSEPSGKQNLLREGVEEVKIYFVGNVMIDSLMNYSKRISNSSILEKLQLKPKSYAVLTLHRPENVDHEEKLETIINAISEVLSCIKIIFPAHPRTMRRLVEYGLMEKVKKLKEDFRLIEPLGYLDFLKLVGGAKFVLTDSGGIQEETTFLGISCLTLRENTERPITISEGTNVLVGTDRERIIVESLKALNGKKPYSIPQYWDGKTSERIVKVITESNKR